MNMLLALLPFLVAFIMLILLQQPVQRTGIITLVIACGVILFTPIFHLVPTLFFSTLGGGVGLALSLFATLFPALLLYQLLSITGATETIAQSIRRYCPQPELQVLLFVLGFSPLIEGLCGFGVGIVVTVPLFLALGLSRRQAALLSILGQPSTMWGAMANGLTLAAKLSHTNADPLGANAALLLAPAMLGGAYAALLISGGRDALRAHWAIATLTGGLLVVGEWFFSQWPGIELAGVCSSLLPILFILGWNHTVVCKYVLQRQDTANSLPLSLRKALMPYLFVIFSLLCMRLIAPLREWGQGNMVLSLPFLHLSIPLLTIPGFWLFMVSVLTVLLFGVTLQQLAQALQQTHKRFLPSATTMLTFLTTSQLMLAAGMIVALGTSVSALGSTYSWFTLSLGLLGGWLTGSITSGNAMFVQLQQVVADHSHLSVSWIEAAQCVGCALGRTTSPSCLVLATKTANIERGEAYLFRRIGPLVGGYLLLITVLFVEVFIPFSGGLPTFFPGVFMGVSIVLCLLIGAIWKSIFPVMSFPLKNRVVSPHVAGKMDA